MFVRWMERHDAIHDPRHVAMSQRLPGRLCAHAPVVFTNGCFLGELLVASETGFWSVRFSVVSCPAGSAPCIV